jgi:pimeloyl-ACP methyl ester carboxylesterase
MSMIRERRVELAGSTTRVLELETDGPASGPALVLLHGWGDSADSWRPVLGRLAARGRAAIALDLPGFGEAAPLAPDEPILPQLDATLAAAIEREAKRSAAGSVVIAGNSLGGCAALRAAERRDLPVAGVVPIAPAGLQMARWFAVIEGEALLRLLLAAPVPVPELIVREVVGRVYRGLAFARPGEVDPAVVASFTRHIRSRDAVTRLLGTGRRLLPELNNPFRLHRIDCPVLLVWGDSDRMVFSAGAERVLRAVEGARIEVIEHCGHCPQIETPDRLTDLLCEFSEPLAQAA